MLGQGDFLCINIGNSHQRMLNDEQYNMRPAKDIIRNQSFLYTVFDVKTAMEVQVEKPINENESYS